MLSKIDDPIQPESPRCRKINMCVVNLAKDRTIARIEADLRDGVTQIQVDGVWGSFGALLATWLVDQLDRPILYIRPHLDDAHQLADDITTFGLKQHDLLPAWEGDEDLADATDEIRAERLRLALRWAQSRPSALMATSIQALIQPVPQPHTLKQSCLYLHVNQDIDPDQVATWLVDNGFETVEQIDMPGQFARRGGILDVFAPICTGLDVLSEQVNTHTEPGESGRSQTLRVEFFGDTIESIRRINLDTHRSCEQFGRVGLVSATQGTDGTDITCFLQILPPDTLVILDEPLECQEVAKVFVERSEHPEHLYRWETLQRELRRFQQMHLARFGSRPGESIGVSVKSIQRVQHQAKAAWEGHQAALEHLLDEADQGKQVWLYCESAAEQARLHEILNSLRQTLPASFQLVKGMLHQGFELEDLQTILVSHHELFGQYSLRRVQRPMRQTAAVDSLADLVSGDIVVHAAYGIGKFIGVDLIEEKGGRNEYLTLEYADETRIRVAVSNITLIQKYIGTSPRRPKLSKVGSKKWQKQKEKVARSVQDLAADMLEVQARRQASGGVAFAPDSHYQQEFEACFPYQETPDQVTAIAEIKADMERSIAMDRLLCGDVGYGKTEIAMRAAFKAVENGKQVAVLVPTTVLCVQHGRTFRERFADFPITIEVLNRFRTAKQARDVLERCQQGRVDILIGTHRLLSKDVHFKDLGLLIIDEEQRFGVEHKERLKRLRVNVDILTMSATPIPRTLHMSLLGLRDISSLATPPLDRRAVVTRITPGQAQTLRKGILQELQRGGQVFFLHNRVKSIARRTHDLEKLINDKQIRFRIAHGQMSKRELESAMISFVTGQTDVLVCTTIIESGLDIPNANTIFIDNADQFGLAELHQLRGRVGRYHHRAYAYMLLPTRRSLTPIGAKRLKAIEEYSHLGAGFKIALRDLEIRGAGNLLGAEQSGHIQLVGYQMYCEMLAQAVRKLKNEPQTAPIPQVALDLGFNAVIPREYISSDRFRMDVYRRIASCRSREGLCDLVEELVDVYGPIPADVDQLIQLADIRIAAAAYEIQHIGIAGKHLSFTFKQPPGDRIHGLFARVKGTIRIPDPKTLYLELAPNTFEPPSLLMVLRKIFKMSR